MFVVLSAERGIEARVGDLGLATLLAGGYQADLVDNPTWSAPEMIRKADRVTEKADVFAYAIIMWELLTLKEWMDGWMEGGWLCALQLTLRRCSFRTPT